MAGVGGNGSLWITSPVSLRTQMAEQQLRVQRDPAVHGDARENLVGLCLK